jgi:type I restriction enzyme S subunit
MSKLSDEWKLAKLGDIADMCLGKMLDQEKNKGDFQPYLANLNVRWGNFDFSNLSQMRFEKNEHDRYGLKFGDIVICEGGEPGRCAIWKEEVAEMKIQKALHRVRIKEDYSNQFVYYRFLLAGINRELEKYFTGSTIKHLTGNALKKVTFAYPPLPIQQKIATILSAYDDLIENNLKQIKLLEEMAQITYEEWFVRFKFHNYENTPVDELTGLPLGWEENSVGNLGEYLNGYAFKPDDLGKNGLPVIKIKEMKSGIDSSTPRNLGHNIPKKYIVERGDIVFSWSASLEVVIWQSESGLLNQHLFMVTPNENILKSFLYLALKNVLPIFDSLTTGATMKHIKRQELDFVKVCVPTAKIMKNFDEIIEPVLTTVTQLNHQNQLLKEARDILLPRLMTGKIAV